MPSPPKPQSFMLYCKKKEKEICINNSQFNIELLSVTDKFIYHHLLPSARISLTLSRHPSLSFIASGRSSGLHPLSTQSCYGWLELVALLCSGFHRSTSFMTSFLLLQQFTGCLVRLIFIVFVMGGRWTYSWFLGCCLQDLFNIARSILV